MITDIITGNPDLTPELTFVTSRSGGKGGQNVNKVETKVALRFDIPASGLLNDEQKKVLLERLSGRLTAEGVLQVISTAARTQQDNKKIALEKFRLILEKAFKREKPRKPTAPTRASREKKLADKKNTSQKKQMRRAAPDMEN